VNHPSSYTPFPSTSQEPRPQSTKGQWGTGTPTHVCMVKGCAMAEQDLNDCHVTTLTGCGQGGSACCLTPHHQSWRGCAEWVWKIGKRVGGGEGGGVRRRETKSEVGKVSLRTRIATRVGAPSSTINQHGTGLRWARRPTPENTMAVCRAEAEAKHALRMPNSTQIGWVAVHAQGRRASVDVRQRRRLRRLLTAAAQPGPPAPQQQRCAALCGHSPEKGRGRVRTVGGRGGVGNHEQATTSRQPRAGNHAAAAEEEEELRWKCATTYRCKLWAFSALVRDDAWPQGYTPTRSPCLMMIK